jgi:pimeloyl-ACP methyl ester carboxylesterase
VPSNALPLSKFTPSWRGGGGEPLVLLHGFTDTWRTWELVAPQLARTHDVLAPTLAGHAGGPPLSGAVTTDVLADAVAAAMKDAGMTTAHIVGNSLGGYVALQLAERGLARSVTALAPAGGWMPDAEGFAEMIGSFSRLQDQMRLAAPGASRIVATPAGRRSATRLIVVNSDHIPPALIAHQMLGIAACPAVQPMVAHALAVGYPLDPARVTCPIRMVWGTDDQLLPLPHAATRYSDWFPAADWIELDDVGHCPQLDVPAVAAGLIQEFAAG